MAHELISLTLNEQDEPVLAFTHNPKSDSLEQKLLGALIRKARFTGTLQLKLVSTYGESDDKPLYDYHIQLPQGDDC